MALLSVIEELETIGTGYICGGNLVSKSCLTFEIPRYKLCYSYIMEYYATIKNNDKIGGNF